MFEMEPTASTEVGALPHEWRVERFDALFVVQQGKQVSRRNRLGENKRPFLRTKNVFWGRLDLSELDEMHFSEADEQRLALQHGDLLICEGGDIGRTAIWRNEVVPCYYQNHLHRARLRDYDKAVAEFILYWLWYAFEVGNVYFGRGNVTTIPNLSQSKLCELPIPVPPLSEQRKIAGILGLVQRAMEQQERLIAKTAELKKALLHHLFTHGLRNEPQKETEIGPIPESWEVVRLEDVTTTVYRYPTYYSITYVETGVPEIRGELLLENGDIEKDLSNFRFISEETASRFPKVRLETGDIVMSVRGTMGKIGIVTEILAGGVITANLIRLAPDRSILRPEFFRWVLLTPRFLQSLNAASPQTTIKTITALNLKELKLPLPSLSGQDEIAAAFNAIASKESLHRRKLAALRDLFRTLLHELMTAPTRQRNRNPRGDHQKRLQHLPQPLHPRRRKRGVPPPCGDCGGAGGAGGGGEGEHRKLNPNYERIGMSMNRIELPDLPKTWRVATLGQIASGFVSGGTPSTKNESFWRGDIPWITSKWINSRVYLDSGEKYISEEAVSESATTIVPKGNLIFATRVGVGKVAINRLDLAINQDLTGILIKPDYNLEFIAYQLRSDRLQSAVASHKRGATIQGITRENLKTLELVIPPLSEQRKIAGILGLVQRAMEQQERLIAKTTELKKALLHHLFTHGLRNEPQKQTEIGPIPESWEVKSLGEVCHPPQYGFTESACEFGNVHFLRITDITDSGVEWANVPFCVCPADKIDKYRLMHGDIVFARIGATTGKSFFISNPPDAVFASYLIRIRPKKNLNANFLSHFFKTECYWKQVNERKHANLKKGMSGSLLKTLLIPVPSFSEQQEIANVFSTLELKESLHRRKLAALRDLFRTLLHELMTAPTRNRRCTAGSWSRTSSNASSTCRRTSSTTPPRPASSWCSTRPSPKGRDLPRLEGSGEILPHRDPRGDHQKRLQHLPQPLHPRRRKRGVPPPCGDCGGAGGAGGGGEGDMGKNTENSLSYSRNMMEIEINIPTGWEVHQVREVGEVVTGRTPSTRYADFYGGDFKLISPADLDNGKYVTTAHRWLTSLGLKECRSLPKDTVLVGCIGNIGKLGMVADEQAATNQQINAVICNQNHDPHFIYYCFYANRSRLVKAADKTTVPILNKRNFETFKIVVPPPLRAAQDCRDFGAGAAGDGTTGAADCQNR